MDRSELTPFLIETNTVQFNNPEFATFLQNVKRYEDPRFQAIEVYQFIRDAFLYDPYHLDLRPEALNTLAIIKRKRAWCVEKSIVTVAALRYLGIPARFGFGIVKNHIGVEKLLHYLKREEIVFHGFVEVFLDNNWIKCTPAFDTRICKLSGVPVLEWDGINDSLFQPYAGQQLFMEYVHFYGAFQDIPFDLMHQEMEKYYPHLFSNPIDERTFSFRFDSTFLNTNGL